MSITEFFRGETKEFTFTISKEGVVQNITGDVVTVRVKNRQSDSDANALIEQAADVATDGANGNAIFKLLPAATNVATGNKFIDVVWETGGDEFVIYDDRVRINVRVSDA